MMLRKMLARMRLVQILLEQTMLEQEQQMLAWLEQVVPRSLDWLGSRLRARMGSSRCCRSRSQ